MTDISKSSIYSLIELSTNNYAKLPILYNMIFGKYFKYKFSLNDIEKESAKIFREYLLNEYNLETHFHSDYIDNGNYEDIVLNIENSFDTEVLVDISKKLMVEISTNYITIISEYELPIDVKEKLVKIQKDNFDGKVNTSVHILSHSSERGMYLSDFEIDDKYKDLDIDLNYNDDFVSINESILSNLDKNQIGLYLLHGLHGTGKTTYLRYLIRNVKKRVIFVSPSMADQFSNPDMIPFLMKYSNSIIIIEDSENIIKTRESGGGQSVSNLLNLSDGILGDILKFQIICTFNTNKSDIDPALLRRGRLIESYEFKKLSLTKTNNLLSKLKYEKSDKPLSLSDIYNQKENHFKDNNDRKIGFK